MELILTWKTKLSFIKNIGLNPNETKCNERSKNLVNTKIGDIVEFSYYYDFVSKRQEKKWMDDKCYAIAIIKDLNPEEFKLKVKLKKSCDRKGIVILKYDVYDKVDGEFRKIEKDKTEIMKKGETRWSLYNLWSIVEK